MSRWTQAGLEALTDEALLAVMEGGSRPERMRAVKEAGRRRLMAAAPGLRAMLRRVDGASLARVIGALRALGDPTSARSIERVWPRAQGQDRTRVAALRALAALASERAVALAAAHARALELEAQPRRGRATLEQLASCMDGLDAAGDEALRALLGDADARACALGALALARRETLTPDDATRLAARLAALSDEPLQALLEGSTAWVDGLDAATLQSLGEGAWALRERLEAHVLWLPGVMRRLGLGEVAARWLGARWRAPLEVAQVRVFIGLERPAGPLRETVAAWMAQGTAARWMPYSVQGRAALTIARAADAADLALLLDVARLLPACDALALLLETPGEAAARARDALLTEALAARHCATLVGALTATRAQAACALAPLAVVLAQGVGDGAAHGLILERVARRWPALLEDPAWRERLRALLEGLWDEAAPQLAAGPRRSPLNNKKGRLARGGLARGALIALTWLGEARPESGALLLRELYRLEAALDKERVHTTHTHRFAPTTLAPILAEEAALTATTLARWWTLGGARDALGAQAVEAGALDAQLEAIAWQIARVEPCVAGAAARTRCRVARADALEARATLRGQAAGGGDEARARLRRQAEAGDADAARALLTAARRHGDLWDEALALRHAADPGPRGAWMADAPPGPRPTLA